MQVKVDQATLRQIRQLVEAGLYPDEEAVLRSALRSLYMVHPELKLKVITKAYESGKISLGKAAELMGVSQEEMKEILREKGIKLHLGPQTIEELRRDAENA